MNQKPILTIPDDAVAAKLPERADKLPNPKIQLLIANTVNSQLRKVMFGPSMQPSLKFVLMTWVSPNALMRGLYAA